MPDIVIKVEDLAKQYRLGTVGRRTLSHDVNRWWHTVRGKEDPYLKIGQENDRTKKGDSEYVWALQDINFEVKQGEVLGIIGRNGAGKSTLLKILSKVTAPTKGNVKIKGRIASLLEVGTGFHPDLSGRDNIFLNGAILGMTKKEIAKKFDEIVDFAGVERYIDTPVKRYSSGMYVRLAFAVAAHLEPDILIVDEVLAVGDAEFQKKCLGKMKDVSEKDGRTVLFVSHNMGAIESLCNIALFLQNGYKHSDGSVDDVLQKYTDYIIDKTGQSQSLALQAGALIRNYKFFVNDKKVENGLRLLMGERLEIEIEILATQKLKDVSVAIDILNTNKELYSHLINEDDGFFVGAMEQEQAKIIKIITAPIFYIPGFYAIDLWIGNYQSEGYYRVKNALFFSIEQSKAVGRTSVLPKKMKYFLSSSWSYQEENF